MCDNYKKSCNFAKKFLIKMIKTIINFLKSKFLWVNIVCAVAVAILLGFGLLTFLKFYTRHGESVEVPDLIGLYDTEAEPVVRQSNLMMEIVDSVYLRDQKGGTIVEQTPKAGSKVKYGRVIYLTVNAKAKKQITVPNLVNMSKRQATYTLNSIGFAVGNVEVVPSEFGDLVIEIKYNGRIVEAGEHLSDGTILSLVVGENGANYNGEMVFVPILTGLCQNDAESKITANDMIVGIVEYDANPANDADRTQYVVYRQSPEAGESVVPGKRIDIWLSKDTKKVQSQKQGDDFFN
jgi:beta-lactam-binding protein with PASTA domain